MKLIIAGSRDLHINRHFLNSIISYLELERADNLTILNGGCQTGIDKTARAWTERMIELCGDTVKLKIFPADWDQHGKAAGPIRNKQMAEEADELLLIWDGESKGSMSMKDEMTRLGKPVREFIIK